MKKMIEVEYVGLEDVQEIFNDAYALMNTGNYVNVSLCSLGGNYDGIYVEMSVQRGEVYPDKPNDFTGRFTISEDAYEVERMKECKAALKKFLKEWD